MRIKPFHCGQFNCLISAIMLSLIPAFTTTTLAETSEGYESLFMGHSFFRPVAEGLAVHAAQVGITGHSQTNVFSGGCGGAPLSLWNDPVNSTEIKAVLDTGNVELFGMTYHGCAPTTEGYELWFDYALSKNPDTVFFIALPWPDFPEQNYADAAAYASFWESAYEPQWLTFIDSLRALYPDQEIFSIPYGQAAVELYKRFEAGNLPDVSSLTGDNNDAVFTDAKGHAGQILVDTCELVWLNAIYGVDLDTYDHDPGYITDIKAIARDIMDAHNPDYNGPLRLAQSESPTVQRDSTYTVIIEEDITYADGLAHDLVSMSIAAMPQKLDVYYPDNDSTNRPVYMFIHGGGFQGGTKTKPEIVDMANYFASRGWVFASVDYRTTSDFPGIDFTGIAPQEWIDFAQQNATTPGDVKTAVAMYAAQRDAKAALRWIVANASTYNANPDFITVGGASAGAITTIALGVSDQEDFRDEIPLSEDPTLSTTNLDQTYEVRSLVDLWGGNVKLDLYESVYGVERYDSNDPDLFIAHGTEDPTVLFSEAEDMVQLYDSTGAHVELYTLEGRGHGAWNATVDGKSLSELSFDFLVDGQDLTVIESQTIGDFNGDGVVDCNDLDGYVGNIGAVATGELATLDLDGNGFLSAIDADTHITTLVETSNGQVGTFPGDLNCDGTVDVLGDAFRLVGNLGSSISSYSDGDIDFDGAVTVLGDAFVLVANLGSSN